MPDKSGRNDPCPCGSGKKFKQCCLLKVGGSGVKKKLKAVWVNKPAIPQGVNLMERTFGQAIAEAEKNPPSFLTPPLETSQPQPEETSVSEESAATSESQPEETSEPDESATS